jgi:acyl-CoA thioester hydrolase
MTTYAPPEGYWHATPIEVRWGDLDAMGHVNNAKYLTYLEHARIRYFDDVHLWDGQNTRRGMIMARVELDYKFPLTLAGDVVVYTRVSRLGTKSLDSQQQIVRYSGGLAEVAAAARIVLVVYDYDQGRSAPIPDDWRALLRAREPGLA